MDPSKPWLIVEIVHPELQPTRFARRAFDTDIDEMLFVAGFVTATHDDALPYPARYPLVVYSWRAEVHDAPRPPELRRKTRARHPSYAEARDRSTAMRKATSWGRLPRQRDLRYA